MSALLLALLGMTSLPPCQRADPDLEERVSATLDVALEASGPTQVARTAAIGPVGAIRLAGAGSLVLGGPQPALGDAAMHSAGSAEIVTQILVLDLVARGELELDAPIAGLVPALSNLDPRILLSTALEGRSGLRDVRDVLHVRRRGERATADIGGAAGWIARMRVRGDRPTVSDTVLLAAVLEHRARRPLAELARAELFDPLGMESTAFADAASSECALAYVRDAARGVSPAGPHGRLHAIEGLYTTAPDLLRLVHELHEPRVLHPDLLQTLLQVADGWRGLSAVSSTTPGGRQTLVLAGRSGAVALALLVEEGWGVTCLDALSPGGARKRVRSALMQIDRVFDASRRPVSWLGIGGGSGGRYGGRFGPLRGYDSSGLAGRYHLPELGLELVVTSDDERRLHMTLEGWPKLRSTGMLSRELSDEGDVVVFTALDGSLRARLEVRVDEHRLVPTGLTLEGDFQRHGTLDHLALEKR